MAYKVLGPGILGLSEFQKLVCWSLRGEWVGFWGMREAGIFLLRETSLPSLALDK